MRSAVRRWKRSRSLARRTSRSRYAMASSLPEVESGRRTSRRRVAGNPRRGRGFRGLWGAHGLDIALVGDDIPMPPTDVHPLQVYWVPNASGVYMQ